jgi:hypothetical protein
MLLAKLSRNQLKKKTRENNFQMDTTNLNAAVYGVLTYQILKKYISVTRSLVFL